ncbi:Na(+)-translocating NADH-quinone reductase subunit C [Congregibacter litoralis]|uniref:Na(+)-translocating NADH-quinone reductase subunit C n=1 Tax=Congregibacter litoralis KT71 TaxID=314285 RepID=A4A894_9GAMM|nr:Na(+)-translocating NADH-quinone reductase subunit C [Congregibacter litoralis]EAQ97889.1 NADH:ubiquinone oxidoreductase, Na(+)-translocating, C subunit [Congregibacter litoralis KT71]
MASNDGIGKILGVALALCIVCSVIVSTAAVVLKPAQEANKTLDRKRNILQAAGMLEEGRSVDEQFSVVEERFVDLSSGQFTDDVAPGYDQQAASKDPSRSRDIPSDEDIAKLGRQASVAQVYLVRGESGEYEKIILPVHGYGLWSTLYGFLALESDGNTVAGLGFYDHGETPGLGGEVDNPRWKSLWPGKKVYRDGEVELSLAKGAVDPSSPNADWKVDGLSGATLTSRGVTNLIDFWLGDAGFAPFLENLRNGEA